MMLEESNPVVIVGAGPAGSLLAILLAKRGHDVTVFESRSDLRRVDISAGRSINLALATRGIVALRAGGVMDRVDPITIPMRGRMVHVDGSTSLQPYGSREHEVIHSVSRRDLNAILLDAAEQTGRVRIEFDQRCRGVDFERKQLVISDSSNGDAIRREPFGVLFGADGSRSVVRDAVVAANGGTARVEPLDHGYKELELPAGTGDSFQLDSKALHIWPRDDFMLIALANPGGDFTVTLFAPLNSAHDMRTDSFDSLTGRDEVNDFFEREFPDFAALVPDLADQFLANPTGHLATIRTTGWSVDADAVLVGDAAHGVVPFHGQGMNAAMESCLVLARSIDESPDDLAAAFRSFEADRSADTNAIADMAIDNYIEMRADVVDPQYQLTRSLALELERRWPDRIRPRYSMVMFTTMPYAAAQTREQQQQTVYRRLTEGVSSLDQVDFDQAEVLVHQLDPLPPAVTSGGDLTWR